MAGRRGEPPQSVPAWSRAELDELIEGIEALLADDEPAVRAAAARLRADLLGFAERVSPSRVRSDASSEAVEAALEIAHAAVHLVTELGDARDMVHGAGTRLTSSRSSARAGSRALSS